MKISFSEEDKLATMSESKIILFFLLNFVLACWTIAIWVDGLIKYQLGFWLNLPMMVVPIFFFKSLMQYNRIEIRILFVYDFLNVIMVIIFIPVYILNFRIWIDLFDGTTSALF
ncbi:MAG TPA: hypothetical protein DCQ93_10540 [Bacteroidetes bacterium]|nr:hypothetical protein [Bacteroidota bacterium]